MHFPMGSPRKTRAARIADLARICVRICGLLLLAGCSALPHAATPPQGRVMGGSQPIAGAAIQLYAVSTTTDGGPATPLLASPLSTDANGYFSLYGKFTCPDPAALTFLTSTGGSPSLAGGAVNPDIALVAAIGRCDTAAVLNPIQIDEVTTVAAVAALAPFMSSTTAIGSTPAHAGSLEFSFAQAAEMANLADGASPGAYVASGDLVPFVVINSLADTLSACVNSAGGTLGDATRCGQFFAETGFYPGAGTDTVSALLALHANPSENTIALFNLAPAGARFQPTLSLPPLDFGIGITHPEPVEILPLAGITFGDQPVSTASAAQTVVIYNSGATTETVAGVSIEGVNASDFAISGACLGPLAAGASCDLRLVFSPTQRGRRSAYLSVQTTGTSSNPPAMTLAGTGT